MTEFLQNILLGSILILALGYIIFRLSTRTKALTMNKTPSCHQDGGEEESCPYCHPEATE